MALSNFVIQLSFSKVDFKFKFASRLFRGKTDLQALKPNKATRVNSRLNFPKLIIIGREVAEFAALLIQLHPTLHSCPPSKELRL